MTIQSNPNLPDYENPPVIEVVFGMQFLPMAKFRAPHIGIFWQRIMNEYPKFQEMPVLSPVIEKFDQEIKAEQISVELTEGPPLPRLFFLDAKENWVLQIQNDRFLYNWKKVTDTDIYPRYNVVSERFFGSWKLFCDFCRIENWSIPKINQLELTYINHISVRENRSFMDEVDAIFPNLRWRGNHDFLPDPESLTWNTSFRLPNNEGRLHISLRHAFRRKDRSPVLLLELTARGYPIKSDPSKISAWFNQGHEWIVGGFADLTDREMQGKLWGRKNDAE